MAILTGLIPNNKTQSKSWVSKIEIKIKKVSILTWVLQKILIILSLTLIYNWWTNHLFHPLGILSNSDKHKQNIKQTLKL